MNALIQRFSDIRGPALPEPFIGYNPRMNPGESATAAGCHPVESEEAHYHSLLARMAARDEAALAQFYDATAARVYALARRITGQPQAAEEVASDVYLQVWRQAQRYDAARGKVIAWVLTICRSRALDHRRRQDQAQTHPDPDRLRPDLCCDDGAPLDLLLAVERSGHVHAALTTLNETQRHLLSLSFFEGLSHQEIAARTGMPLGSAKTVLRKALQTLKEILQPTVSTEETP